MFFLKTCSSAEFGEQVIRLLIMLTKIHKKQKVKIMTETATEQTQPVSVQKDENGIDIVKGPLESWNFIPDNHDDFLAKFLRVVSIEGTQYAEVEVSDQVKGGQVIRYCRLLYYPGFTKCETGTPVHCRRILGKRYIFAEQSCKCGRILSQDEWTRISTSPNCRTPLRYPDTHIRLLEA